jgi:glycosyltransferase involved in cell wall biosynthesis
LKISIIIPTYKRNTSLEIILKNLKKVKTFSYEIIIVDDCEKYGSFLLSKKFNAVYVCKSGSNKGPSYSRNIGIYLSTTDYLYFLDDDDEINILNFENFISYVFQNNDKKFFYSNYNLINKNKKIFYNTNDFTYEDLLVCNRFPIGSFLIKKSSIKKYFDVNLESHEDWNFILDNINWCETLHFNETICNINQLETSRSTKNRKFFLLDFITIYNRFPNFKLKRRRRYMLKEIGYKFYNKIYLR